MSISRKHLIVMAALAASTAGTAHATLPHGSLAESAGGSIVALMPSQQVARQMSSGCWARFYDHPGYQGETLTLVGPADLPQLKIAQWTRHRWDSVVVGPRARLAIYSQDNYARPSQRLDSGERVELPSGAEPRSVRVDCLT